MSTGLVYGEQSRPCREGDPIDTLHPYGASKAAADCLLRAGAERLKRHLTVLRPFSFTGLHDGGDRLFPSLLRSALKGEPFSMSAGTQIRDFCAVQDVAEAVCLVLEEERCPVAMCSTSQRRVDLAAWHRGFGLPPAWTGGRTSPGRDAVPSL